MSKKCSKYFLNVSFSILSNTVFWIPICHLEMEMVITPLLSCNIDIGTKTAIFFALLGAHGQLVIYIEF